VGVYRRFAQRGWSRTYAHATSRLILAGSSLRISEGRESVEERTLTGVAAHRNQQLGELFLDCGVLQGTAVERLHASQGID
jgi:hypothetical protein